MTDTPPGILTLPAEAVRALYDVAATGRGPYAAVLSNNGFVKMQEGDYAGAYRMFRAALAIEPDNREIMLNQAATLKFLNRNDEAIALYEAMVTRWPEWTKGMWNYCHLLLRLGRFEEGWRYNRTRMWFDRSQQHPGVGPTVQILDPLKQRPYNEIAIPDAESIKMKGLFIAPEQGLGDELFYLRWLGVVHQKFRPKVVWYIASRKLHDMLARTTLPARLLIRDESIPEYIDRDMPLIALADLPLLCGHRGLDDIPPPIAIPPLAHGEETLYGTATQKRPATARRWIGVTWRAGVPGARHRGGLDKSIPPGLLGAALKGVDAEFVVVHRELTHTWYDEYMALSVAVGRPDGLPVAFQGVIHPTATELEYVLRLMADLDDYVTVSNTNVYLRQAMGKVSRVLVPFPPAWRWMDGPGDSPWFAGHPTYRETTRDGWEGALARLRADLTLAEPE